jgi:phage baseplate assembly protein W
MNNGSFLGTGWSFPPSFDKTLGQVEMTSEEADIRSSLHILLTTRQGERVMQPTYGCNLDALVFESMTATFRSYIRDLVKTAILYHEPRIRLNKVTLDDGRDLEGIIVITIDYTVRTTNTRFNYVFPFYKNEGSDIR